MTWESAVPAVAVTALALCASISDLKSRRVSNALTFGAAGLALVIHFALTGWSGFLSAGAGWATGFALFFPLFVLGGMGAGDVKLLAAVGAWLGPWGALWAALYAALAGGLMALAVSRSHGYTGKAFRNLGTMLRAWLSGGIRPIEGLTLKSGSGPRLPYALPIGVGAIAALWKV